MTNLRSLGVGLGWLSVVALLWGCSSTPPEAGETAGESAQAISVGPLGCDTAECCPSGTTPVVFNDQPNQTTNTLSNRCLVMLGGSDNVTSTGTGTTILAGPGDDVIQGGPNGMIRGGDGRDTIMGFSGGTVYGNAGDDTIMAANGNNVIVPGAGVDTVSGGTGDDTFVINDLCEVSWGDLMDGSGGNNTLITPVPLAQLQALGVTAAHFQKIVVQQNSCKSDCTTKPDCGGHGVCAEGDSPGQMKCQCDAGYSGASCKGCPAGSPKALPGQCGCGLPDHDKDQDTKADCVDVCPDDPTKTVSRGACGCGKPETDGDRDGTPDCIERSCVADAAHSVVGQCGCVGDSSLKPAGIPCGDPVCAGQTSATCNASGVCGDPNACRPNSTCFLRESGDHYYWFCTGGSSFAQAMTSCSAVTGRALAKIDSPEESEFVARVLQSSLSAFAGNAWVGANDQATEGTWRWSLNGNVNGPRFWTGGPGGTPFPGALARWVTAQPGTGNCGAVVKGDATGALTATDCAATLGFVCEQVKGFAPGPVPEGPGSDTFPGRIGNTPKDDPLCIPQSQADIYTDAQIHQQIVDCNAAVNCTETDSSGCGACKGVTSVPPPNSTCPPFEAEEQAYCKLSDIKATNAQGAACAPGQDCCGVTSAAVVGSTPVFGGLLAESFTAGTANFTYVDDAFRGTNQPAYASGTRVTTGGKPDAALQVQLGGIDANAITGISGGWRFSFTLAQPALLGVSFDYNLTQTSQYESDESSQMLVALDSTLWGEPFKDYVAQVAGDGDGGPAVTTGFVRFTRSLGVVPAGAHTLTIGGYNNKKTQADESTTLLVDNVLLQRRVSDCPSGYLCGQVYPDGCNACDEKNDPNDPERCTKQCTGALRCGKPFSDPKAGANGARGCADNSLFGSRCQQIEVCGGPEANGTSDPNAGPGADLKPETFNPSVFGTPPKPIPDYPLDPACDTPPCHTGQENRWCHYDVDDQLPSKPVGPDTKKGGNDASGPVTFSFDPNVGMQFDTKPLAFGQADFNLDASASFKANVDFDLGLGIKGSVDVLDAMAALHADRCQATTGDSHLIILGTDFTPEGLKFDTANKADMDKLQLPTIDPHICRDIDIAKYVKTIGRVKKAYRDALELISLYKDIKASQGTALAKTFPKQLCQKLLADPPKNFPPGSCDDADSGAKTINRFIDYYQGEADRFLQPAIDDLDTKTVKLPLPSLDLKSLSSRESETLFQATFPVGPIPLTLQVEAYAEYGLKGNLGFELNPGALVTKSTEPQKLAMIQAHLTPYALAGSSMFVGVGFGFNGFDLSAGVEGSISLGRVGIDNTAGAGIGVKANDDLREFPKQIAAAAVEGAAAGHQTLFPSGVAKQYDFSFLYRYGSSVRLEQILAGTISGRVRIKLLFFSKTWRKVLLRFPGFGPIEIPLISGGGSVGSGGKPAPAETDGNTGPGWGAAQMPLPFVQLAKLPEGGTFTGTEMPLSDLTKNAEEFFYDSQCQCSHTGEDCYRRGDCCEDGARCLRDPEKFGRNECGSCRTEGVRCVLDDECCDDLNNCFTPPEGGKPATCVGCRKQNDSCWYISQGKKDCCDAKFGCVLFPQNNFGVCRYCQENSDWPTLKCKSPDDCCSHSCFIAQGETEGHCGEAPPK